MQDLQIFKNEEFGEIRAIKIENEPYFIAKDICEILDIKNTTDAIKRLDVDEVTRLNLGGLSGETNLVNEYGLYTLILGSRKREAKQFKRWVTHEVLPSIRKHGGYIAGQEEMTDEEIMAKAILMANSKIKELNKKNEVLQAENSQLVVTNEIMRPKAEYFDDLVDRNLLTGFRETAKMLGIKQNVFMDFLFKHKYIYRDKKGKPQPFSDKNKGLFEIKETKNEKSKWTGTQTLITPKGRETFRLLCVGL